MDDNNNILAYYHAQEHSVPKYKLEEGASRVKRSKLQRYVRTDTYIYEEYNWGWMNDPGHNDFKGIVDIILDSGKSINIDGWAGTGKSFMVNSLIKESEARDKTNNSISTDE